MSAIKEFYMAFGERGLVVVDGCQHDKPHNVIIRHEIYEAPLTGRKVVVPCVTEAHAAYWWAYTSDPKVKVYLRTALLSFLGFDESDLEPEDESYWLDSMSRPSQSCDDSIVSDDYPHSPDLMDTGPIEWLTESGE